MNSINLPSGIKHALLFYFLLILNNAGAQIFLETFDESNLSTSGNDNIGGIGWTANCFTCIDAGDYFHVNSGQLENQDSNGPAVWETTSNIDISSCQFLEISFVIAEDGDLEACGTGCNSVDWVMLEYNIDNTGWQTPPNATFCAGPCADVNVVHSDDIVGASINYTTGCLLGGSTLQLRISCQTWAASERWRLDDITVDCGVPPSVDAGPNQTVCGSQQVTLTATNPDLAVISWNNGVTDGVAFNPMAGSNYYVVTAAAGACFSLDSALVTVSAGPTVNAGTDQTICQGDNVTLTAFNPDGAIISWNNGVVDGFPFSPGLGATTYTVSADTNGCVSTDQVIVTVLANTVVNVTPAGPYTTASGTQNLTATPPGGVWSSNCGACINSGTGVFNPAIAGAGTWQICYTAGTAPCDDIQCIDIVVTDNGPCALAGSITSNNPTCFEFNDGSATINMTGQVGSLTFVITDTNGAQVNIGNSNTANNLATGWYYFEVTDGVPCTVIDSVYLQDPGQMNVDLIVSDPTCYGDLTGSVIIDSVYNFTGAYNQIAYFLTPNPNQNGIGADTITGLAAGMYSLLINDQNGCSETFDITIDQPDSLYLQEFGTEPAYCRLFGYQSGNGVVFVSASGGTPDYDYQWLNLLDSTTSANTTWGGQNPGTYQITVTDNNGCILMMTIQLDSLNPIADFQMSSNDFIAEWEGTASVSVHFTNSSLYFANPNNPNADTTFFWNFGVDPWIISHDYFEEFDTTYLNGGVYNICLVAINKNGCTDTMCVPITIFDPLSFTPVNIFTPNGDGDNDEFTFNHLAKAVVEFQCTILNRWGATIIEFGSITDFWDGSTAQGQSCPDGVYFYVYSGQAENGETFEGQGNIQLIRH